MRILVTSPLFAFLLIACDDKDQTVQELESKPSERSEITTESYSSEDAPAYELRILDVVLIDPRTGNPPPKDAQLRFAAPTGVKFPMIVEKPDRKTDQDPYAFRITWFDEPSSEAFAKVGIQGYQPLEIGLKYAMREKNQTMIDQRIQRVIELEPVETK